MNLLDLLAIPRRETPDRAGLIFRPAGRAAVELSYRELLDSAERLAAALARMGLHAGDRVALHLDSRPELLLAYLATLRLGAVGVPVHAAYTRPEIAHLLADAEPRLLLAEPARRGLLDELSPDERRSVERVLWADEIAELAADPAADPAAGPAPGELPPGPDSGDLALLLYTSGTTGRSKGAMLTHDNLLATITGLLAAWAWRREDVLLLALPLFHTHGLVVGALTALAAGATVVLHPRFDAGAVAAALLGEADPPRPSLFFGVPTMYVRLVDELARRRAAGEGDLRERLDPGDGGPRLFASGSAPLAPETFAAFRDLTGHEPLERYGMTETGMLTSNPYAGPRLPGTVGRPLPGVSLRVVDAGGDEVADGAEGEVVVRGANVTEGYWRAPEKTAEAFLTGPGGRRWFRTGDLGRRDPATGALTLLGRRHELVITGGYNVYPREVEEALAAHPGVREAAVAGVPDRDRGEVPEAWWVAAPGAPPPADDELADWCRARLAPYKVPRRFHRLAELPRNALGKVETRRLPAPAEG